MASHHHHHPQPHPAAACNCHCCYAACPPPPTATHPLQPHFYPELINIPNPTLSQGFQLDPSFQDGRPATYATISSLLRRISALETSLRRRVPHSLRDAAARTIQTHFRAFLCRRSRTLRQLKDLAAIKSALGSLKSLVSKNTQFEYEAVYRRTVNLLLKLDAIQGDDPMIRNGKSSLTIELNKFLDFIDGICVEGKGHPVLGVKVKCRKDDLKSRVSNVGLKLGNLKLGGSKGVNVGKLKALVERIDKLAEEIDEEEQERPGIKNPNAFSIRKSGVLSNKNTGVQSKVKKNVSFVEDGKVYRVSRRSHEPLLDECSDDSVDGNNVKGEGDIEDYIIGDIAELGVSSREIKDDDNDDDDDGEEVHLENEVEGRSRSHPVGYGRMRGDDEDEDDDDDDGDEFVFRPPLPMEMETRGGITINKRMKTPK